MIGPPTKLKSNYGVLLGRMPEANVVRVGFRSLGRSTDFVLGKLGLIGYDSLAIFPIQDITASNCDWLNAAVRPSQKPVF